MTTRGNFRYALPSRAHFYAQVTLVLQLPNDGEGLWDTLGDEFFSFFLKNMDRKGIWRTLEDAIKQGPVDNNIQDLTLHLWAALGLYFIGHMHAQQGPKKGIAWAEPLVVL